LVGSGAVATEVEASIAERLRSMGQRLTPKRRALVEVMTRARHPMTIGEILAQDGSLALSSAYRNLTVLEHAGVVRRVVTEEDFARFELAEDLTEHHHHLMCEACGLVEDFEVRPQLERSVDAELASIASRRGFVVRSHRIDVIGLCPSCAARSDRSGAPAGAPARSNGRSSARRAE
jgi:Fur family transcriptional regulator, ferric uptake regulator